MIIDLAVSRQALKSGRKPVDNSCGQLPQEARHDHPRLAARAGGRRDPALPAPAARLRRPDRGDLQKRQHRPCPGAAAGALAPAFPRASREAANGSGARPHRVASLPLAGLVSA